MNIPFNFAFLAVLVEPVDDDVSRRFYRDKKRPSIFSIRYKNDGTLTFAELDDDDSRAAESTFDFVLVFLLLLVPPVDDDNTDRVFDFIERLSLAVDAFVPPEAEIER